jgi:predicted nucleotidyltransferase component of viral defense system
MKIAIEQSIKSKLRNLSLETGVTFNELWLELSIERFLYRLSRSRQSKHFIFKGGLLLKNYIELNRETRDVDFSLSSIENSIEGVKSIIQEILSRNLDDGYIYSLQNAEELIHPQAKYNGIRVSILASLGNMKQKFSVDIGFGDVADFTKKEINILPKDKSLFSESKILLQVYNPEYIFSEKLETGIFFGKDNSRMKDYHDMYFIIKNNILNKLKLKAAITKTFTNRKTELKFPVLDFKPDKKMEKYWKGHLKKVKNMKLPESINPVIDEINQFVFKVFHK